MQAATALVNSHCTLYWYGWFMQVRHCIFGANNFPSYTTNKLTHWREFQMRATVSFPDAWMLDNSGTGEWLTWRAQNWFVATGCSNKPVSSHLRFMDAWILLETMGPVRIPHSSHDFGWQSSHSVDLAGWQGKMTSIEIWIPWRNAHKPHHPNLILEWFND